MQLVVQEGKEPVADSLRQAIYKAIQAGAECEAHEARRKHAERLKLLGKRCEGYVPEGGQGSLFE